MSKPFDRVEHCRRIGAAGGTVTAQRYGAHHMRVIGKAGWQRRIANHDIGYCRGHLDRKRWHGRRRESLAVDLAAGKVYAEMAA